MGAVTASQVFPGTVAEAERCWYETARWSQWIDGLDRVLAVDGPWPETGAAVTWESGPAGRGRVTEQVIAYELRRGQTLEVGDASITGRQSVVFEPSGTGVEVTMRLEYRLRRRSPLTPLLDILFIRRAMAASLETTVSRFGAELRTSRPAPGA
jgi:Polyketide cyclase / dehydrase and lipid transport